MVALKEKIVLKKCSKYENKIVGFFVLPSQKEVGTRVLVKPILRSNLNAFCAKLGACIKGGASFPYSRITIGHQV